MPTRLATISVKQHYPLEEVQSDCQRLVNALEKKYVGSTFQLHTAFDSKAVVVESDGTWRTDQATFAEGFLASRDWWER